MVSEDMAAVFFYASGSGCRPTARTRGGSRRATTAHKIGVNIVGEALHMQITRLAQTGATRAVCELVGQNELDTAHGDVLTAGALVGRDDKGFHAARLLVPSAVGLGQHNGQRHTLARTYSTKGDTELNDATLGV